MFKHTNVYISLGNAQAREVYQKPDHEGDIMSTSSVDVCYKVNAPLAVDYYPKLGFEKHSNTWLMPAADLHEA